VRVDEHTIEVAGATILYRSASWTGIPPLYLHGAPTSSDDWIAFLERTGGIAPDLIGFGRSGKAGNLDYSIDGYGDFLERLLDELQIDRVKLVAHDWGAAGGLVFAQRHPGRVERLVLCDALPMFEGYKWPLLARLFRRPAIGELVMGSITKPLLGRALRRACVHPDAWPDARVSSVWEQFDQGTQRAILRLHRSANEQRLAAAGSELSRLEAPSLVIWGECDSWFAAELADGYASRLPQATLERIADAGHWPWLDQPRVVDLVASFLAD